MGRPRVALRKAQAGNLETVTNRGQSPRRAQLFAFRCTRIHRHTNSLALVILLVTPVMFMSHGCNAILRWAVAKAIENKRMEAALFCHS
jgi:hypothetical protein